MSPTATPCASSQLGSCTRRERRHRRLHTQSTRLAVPQDEAASSSSRRLRCDRAQEERAGDARWCALGVGRDNFYPHASLSHSCAAARAAVGQDTQHRAGGVGRARGDAGRLGVNPACSCGSVGLRTPGRGPEIISVAQIKPTTGECAGGALAHYASWGRGPGTLGKAHRRPDHTGLCGQGLQHTGP